MNLYVHNKLPVGEQQRACTLPQVSNEARSSAELHYSAVCDTAQLRVQKQEKGCLNEMKLTKVVFPVNKGMSVLCTHACPSTSGATGSCIIKRTQVRTVDEKLLRW